MMKRSRIATRAIAAAAVLSAALVSSGGPSFAAGFATQPVSASSAKATSYDGEAVFRGLFFGQGAVAAKFPQLADAQASPPAELNQSIDTLVTQMSATDPAFFDQFGAALTSGKRQRIAKGLESAQDLMAQVVSDRGASMSPDNGGDCIWAFAVAVVTLAAAGNVAYAVNAVSTGNVAWNVNWFWSAPNDANTRLQQEQWVNEIAETL